MFDPTGPFCWMNLGPETPEEKRERLRKAQKETILMYLVVSVVLAFVVAVGGAAGYGMFRLFCG